MADTKVYGLYDFDTGTIIGTIPVANGGTDLSSITQGGLWYASAANIISVLTKDTNATRYLANTGTSNNPAWGQVNLANGVTGLLPYTNTTGIAGSGANSDITSLASITTPLSRAQGGTGYAQAIAPLFATQHAAVSHTGNTLETTLFTITIPGGTLGANGRIRIDGSLFSTNSVNIKTWRLKFGGTLFARSYLTTTDCNADFNVAIWNENATNAQSGTVYFHVINHSSATIIGAIDTTVDQPLIITAQLALGTETATLRGVAVEISKP